MLRLVTGQFLYCSRPVTATLEAYLGNITQAKVERTENFEISRMGWKPTALPLSYARKLYDFVVVAIFIQ